MAEVAELLLEEELADAVALIMPPAVPELDEMAPSGSGVHMPGRAVWAPSMQC